MSQTNPLCLRRVLDKSETQGICLRQILDKSVRWSLTYSNCKYVVLLLHYSLYYTVNDMNMM